MPRTVPARGYLSGTGQEHVQLPCAGAPSRGCQDEMDAVQPWHDRDAPAAAWETRATAPTPDQCSQVEGVPNGWTSTVATTHQPRWEQSSHPYGPCYKDRSFRS